MKRCHAPSTSFLAPLSGRLRTSSQGESFSTFIFTLFLFCLVSFAWFCLPIFIKNSKKISLVWFAFSYQKHKKISSCSSCHLALAHHVDPQVHPERPFNR